MTNFATLKSNIYKHLLKDTSDAFFTSDTVDFIISLAEAEMSRRLRIRELKETATLNAVGGNNEVAYPTDFNQAVSLVNDDGSEITYASPSVFAREGYYRKSGKPQKFFIDGGNFILGGIPDTNYSITLKYYKKIANLSVSNTTNDVLTAYPDLYLYMCLKHAYFASQDVEKETLFEMRVEKIIAELNRTDDANMVLKGAKGNARMI